MAGKNLGIKFDDHELTLIFLSIEIFFARRMERLPYLFLQRSHSIQGRLVVKSGRICLTMECLAINQVGETSLNSLGTPIIINVSLSFFIFILLANV